jgi:hypothetical protein
MIRATRRLGLAGAVCCLLALALCATDARAALAGWLAAFVTLGAVPLGALALCMMVRLMPGPWGAEVGETGEMLATLLPLACLAVLPVLIGTHELYPWATGAADPGFRGVYLSVWFFCLRSVLFLAGALILAFLMMTRSAWALPLAAGGLIVFVLLDTTVVTDWLMSLDADFDSSGFGLYVLSIQMTIALALVVVIRLVAAPELARADLLGALMLVALLLWEYFAFMQYFIIWSENLPKRVAWFQDRGHGIWAAAEYAIALLALVPTFLLFFTAIRRSRAWLLAIAAAMLCAKTIEIAWLVFPAVDAPPTVEVAAMALAVLGLASLAAAFFGWMGRAQPAPGLRER